MRNNIKIPLIIVLVIAIISLGVAFAVFQTTLTINGSATVESTTWDIFFTTEIDGDKPNPSTTVPAANIAVGDTTAESISASITPTVFTWNATFRSPGDRIVYTIYVKNGGDYNAQVSDIDMDEIACTTDPKHVCNQLSYGLYTDTTGTSPLSTSFTVDAGDTEVFYLIATLSSNYGGTDGSELAEANVTTRPITATVTFSQVSSAVTKNGGGNSGGGNSGGNGSPSDGEYLVPFTSGDNMEWVNSSELLERMPEGYNTTFPDVYIRKINGNPNICIVNNSVEYCENHSTTAADFLQLCNQFNAEIDDDAGSNSYIECIFGHHEKGNDEFRYYYINPEYGYDDIQIQFTKYNGNIAYDCSLNFSYDDYYCYYQYDN